MGKAGEEGFTVFFFGGFLALKPVFAEPIDGAIDLLQADPGIQGIFQKDIKSSDSEG